jgi:glycosyltransferase involved in cell wall biosynthesis
MPRVSIVIPAYNHEKYVRECVQSALDQTYQDFEIVITDDGSTDGTVNVIKEFDDSRIQLYTHADNKGACIAHNNCIQKAAGEYIAVLSSDDAWEPTKLAKQVNYLDEHPEIGAVFTKVAFVDESSNLIRPEHYPNYYIFEKDNRSRYGWLREFFLRGNCLCHPSILIRKKCYDDIGLYDERMASLPDLDMWVRLCFKHEIHIIDEKLVRFRTRADEANASGKRLPNIVRGYFEYKQILNHYLAITDKELLLSIFPEATKYGPVENEYIPYFLSMLALSVEHHSKRLWGLEVLYNLLGKDTNAMNIEKKCGFRYLDFHHLTAQHDVFNIAAVLSPTPASRQALSYASPVNHGKLMNLAIRLHWMLANVVLKIYARTK